jgi:hypothetical protein
MTDKNFDSEILRLQKELERKLEWGPAVKWHSSMFDELTEKIYLVSNVMISSATLKRFFKVVRHDGTPSITTLDVLSKFLEYENWRAFRLSKKKRLWSIIEGLPNRSMYVSFGFLLAFITIMLIANRKPAFSVVPDDISFSSRTLTINYPNSVVFDFDLKDIVTDSIYIQQYWDPSKTVAIDKNQSQATGIYYFPGYFRAKLVIDGQPVKEHDLFLRSNGWMGTIEYEPIPKYFTPKKIEENGLSYPKELEVEISSSDQPLVSVYHFINDLGDISGDDFKLEATIKNTYDEKWAICHSSRIYLIGTRGAMIIPFSKVGCSSENNLMLNDLYLNGKENDLSNFGVDLTEFTDIKVDVNNKNVIISLGGQDVYNGNYNDTMGNLVGLRIKFLGLGEIKTLRLLDQYEKEVIL